MRVVYACQELPPRSDYWSVALNTIFLAGPTPRDGGVRSWRPDALDLLLKKGFDGHVFVPEAAVGGWHGNYEEQVFWEWEALGRATCVLFWIPRDLATMPAFTTNVEFGFTMALHPGRIVLGAPADAPKLRYLRTLMSNMERLADAFCAGKFINPLVSDCQADTLEDAIDYALEICRRRQ